MDSISVLWPGLRNSFARFLSDSMKPNAFPEFLQKRLFSIGVSTRRQSKLNELSAMVDGALAKLFRGAGAVINEDWRKPG